MSPDSCCSKWWIATTTKQLTSFQHQTLCPVLFQTPLVACKSRAKTQWESSVTTSPRHVAKCSLKPTRSEGAHGYMVQESLANCCRNIKPSIRTISPGSNTTTPHHHTHTHVEKNTHSQNHKKSSGTPGIPDQTHGHTHNGSRPQCDHRMQTQYSKEEIPPPLRASQQALGQRGHSGIFVVCLTWERDGPLVRHEEKDIRPSDTLWGADRDSRSL